MRWVTASMWPHIEDTLFLYTCGWVTHGIPRLYIIFTIVFVICVCVNILRLKWVSGDFGPRLFRTGDFGRLSVISDGDFGRCAVKSDGDFGRCAVNSDAAVNSDGDFGRCAVNSDAQLSSLLYHYFGTNIASFGWWFRTVISDGEMYKKH